MYKPGGHTPDGHTPYMYKPDGVCCISNTVVCTTHTPIDAEASV